MDLYRCSLDDAAENFDQVKDQVDKKYRVSYPAKFSMAVNLKSAYKSEEGHFIYYKSLSGCVINILFINYGESKEEFLSLVLALKKQLPKLKMLYLDFTGCLDFDKTSKIIKQLSGTDCRTTQVVKLNVNRLRH